MAKFDRITFDPTVMGGRACIRGLRVTVSLILNLVANGMSSAGWWRLIPIWKWKTFARRCAMQPGSPKRAFTLWNRL